MSAFDRTPADAHAEDMAELADPTFWAEAQADGERRSKGLGVWLLAGAAIGVVAAVGIGVAVANATPSTQEVWWLLPDGGTDTHVTWPQSLTEPGVVPCDTWAQVDTYPTPEPSEEPTTVPPSQEPTVDPTVDPTDEPTTDAPTEEPTSPEPTEPPTTDEPTTPEPTTPPVTQEPPLDPEPATTDPVTVDPEPVTTPATTAPVQPPTTQPAETTQPTTQAQLADTGVDDHRGLIGLGVIVTIVVAGFVLLARRGARR